MFFDDLFFGAEKRFESYHKLNQREQIETAMLVYFFVNCVEEKRWPRQELQCKLLKTNHLHFYKNRFSLNQPPYAIL